MPSLTHVSSLLPSLPAGSRVLAIRLRSLGDTLLLTPALHALKRWRPDLQISVLLYQRFAPILAGNADVADVLELDADGPTATLAIAHMLDDARRRGFAACFNCHGGTLSAFLTWTSGAPHRIGFEHYRFRWVYTGVAPNARTLFGRTHLHTVEQQIGLFYAAGLPQGDIPPLQLTVAPAARAGVGSELERQGLRPRARYAVLHPVANFFTKEWPFERYAGLARTLEEEFGLVPVFTCGAGEEARLDAVERAAGRRFIRFGDLSVLELAALIEGATLFIGNDSGPAHIAAALGRPAAVLFGSSDSGRWHPWRAPHAVVQNFYRCNPCRGDRCYAFDQPECILSISPEQVREAVEQLLAPVTTSTG